MKAQLGEIEEQYEKRTIHLNDGRRVYVDESGNYTYQDQYGAWNDLEEATAKHKTLGSTAITKDQKVRLDDYEAELLYTDAMIEDNQQRRSRSRRIGRTWKKSATACASISKRAHRIFSQRVIFR